MRSSRTERVVRSFIDRVNAHDVEGLARLMTPRHKFTDALGVSRAGRETVRAGWAGYLRWFPDYRIVCDTLLCAGDVALFVGTASGSFGGRAGARGKDRFTQPAAWFARVHGSLVAEWQIFTDSSVTAAILVRNARRPGELPRRSGRR